MSRLLPLAVLAVPQLAWACPECIGAGQNQDAFFNTMVFLSLMPIGMVAVFAGLVWYLHKRTLEIEQEELAAD